MEQRYIMVIDRDRNEASELLDCLHRATNSLGWQNVTLKRISEGMEAERFADENDVPVVFIGSGVDEMEMFDMIRSIREIRRQTNFILVTDKKDLIIHAIRLGLRLSGCITQSLSCESVTDQLQNLWFPVPA